MTNTDEANDFLKTDRLAFVEMLEMIGRISHVKFQGTEFEFEPLHLKIERILDMMLPLVGAKRREVEARVESESESDDDY